MFENFLNKMSAFEAHHQIIFSIIVFFGVIAMWWSVENLYDTFFLPNIKNHWRAILAFLLGLIILIVTHHIVTELM